MATIKSNMKINIILQARTSSTRLPNKVLMPILGKPMLVHQIERLKQLTCINQLIIATSKEPSDDSIEQLCQQENITCFRGSLNNVLERYYQASQAYPSEHIIRLTGDCPVIDSDIITEVINLHLCEKADYTSNCIPPTLPDGLDVEIFTSKALAETWKKASTALEQEHVTPFIRESGLFKCENYQYSYDYSHLRWTVDEPEDFQLITSIFNELYPNMPHFKLHDILDLIARQPALSSVNQKFMRNEGLEKLKPEQRQQND